MSGEITRQQALYASASTKYDITLSSLNVGASEFTFLTPEALILFCEQKLKGLDTQVKTKFMNQQARNHLSGALSKLASSLNAKSESASGGVKKEDWALKARIEKEFDAAIAAARPNDGLVERLTEQKAKFVHSANGNETHNDEAVADWEIRDMAESIQGVQSDVNRQGELDMIELQSIMSQRQQALQLCTNMVQSIGQSAMGIAQNVGK